MAAGSSPIDPELLLAQAGWVRGLVRRLIQDEALAEEVVQDTYVAALERRGPAGTGSAHETTGLRAWLGAVARNLSLRARRRAFVRRAVESAGARSEHVGGGDEEVERMQLQQQLAGAVLALEEPYRTAVILRHLDGLSHGEIARRQACSVEAARQRVARGLAQLRARLASTHGDRASWCALLVKLAGQGWNGGALVAGGLVMTTKIVAGVAATVLLAFSLWQWNTRTSARGGAPAELARAVEPPEAPASESQPAPALVSANEPAARRALPVASAPALLRGTVTDTRGKPLAAAHVRFLADLPMSVQTSEDGSFAIAADEARESVRVSVECDGYLEREAELDPARAAQIALQALPVLTGRLLTPEGAPIDPPGRVMLEIDRGAEGLERLYAQSAEVDAASTNQLDEQGNFRFASLPLGRVVKLWGRGRGFAPTELDLTLPLEPERTYAQDLTLATGALLTGVVLDARTREPVPGAEVWAETLEPRDNELAPRTIADGFGRFRLEGVEEVPQTVSDGSRRLLFMLLARAEGYVPHDVFLTQVAPSAAHAYELEVLVDAAGASLRGRVLTSVGTPAANASVFFLGDTGNPTFAATDEAGAFLFEGLAAGSYTLWTGDESEDLSTEVRLLAGEEHHEEFRLERGAGRIEGRVLGLDGAGVAGVTMRAKYIFRAHGLALGLGGSELTTDAQGRFAFDGLRAGSWSVTPELDATATPCSLPRMSSLEITSGAVARADFTVGTCFSLEGQLESESSFEGLVLQALDPETGSWCASATITDDGSFRFEPTLASEHDIVLSRAQQVLARWRLGPASGPTTLVVPR